jgi:hypothetical protein
MSGDPAIEAYLAAFRNRLSWRHDVDDLVAEAEDHLLTAVEQLEARGIGRPEAVRTALERYGESVVVARAFAAQPGGGLAIPTRSTRTAGSFAIISALLWLGVAAAWLVAGVTLPTGRVDSAESRVAYVAGAAMLVAGMSLLLAAVLGVGRRHGGLGRLGSVGTVAVGVAAAGSLAAWVFTFWGTCLLLGTVSLAVAMLRRGLAPRPATIAFGSSIVAGGAVWVVLRAAGGGVDLSGFWGDTWAANQVGVVIAALLLAAGLLGLGRWLRSEPAVDLDLPDRTITA